jgi:rhomboid protease GluP
LLGLCYSHLRLISVRTDHGEESLSLDELEARIRDGQIAPTTPVCFPVLTGDRWVNARELELFRRLYEPARVHFTRAFSLRGVPLITLGLVAIQIVLYFGIAGTARSIPVDALIEAGAKVSANIFELGETWRLLAANVLHRDLLHLTFNMFFLFNVGSTIENAYRKQDFLLILCAAGIGTTLTSAAMSPLPSVGSSGIVLGLFGAASVFGAKYTDILPRRYRRYFGGAVLPYALFVLYVGLASPNTDNWGHVGGLAGGALAAIPLEPKLLHLCREERSFLKSRWPLIAVIALIVGPILAAPIVRQLPPSLDELVDRESGLRVVYPKRWTIGENHLGYAALGNTLGASIGLRARRDTRRFDLAEVKARFLEQELAQQEREGSVTAVRVIAEKPIEVSGGKATELVIALESRAGAHRTRNILIERGFYSYAIVLSAPESFAASYGPIFDRMISEIALIEPAWLARSRAVADAFPGMSSAHVELGQHLASVGDIEGAAQAYQQALQALPDHPDALFGLARLAADYGGDLWSAESIAARLYERHPDDPQVASLLADLRQQLGNVEDAKAVLQSTLDRVPEAKELRDQLLKISPR